MAAAAAALLFSPNPTPRSTIHAAKPRISLTILSPAPPAPPLILRTDCRHLRFRPRSAAVEDVSVAEPAATPSEEESPDEAERKRKLYVANLPWNVSDDDIGKLFGECGTVKKVEVIKKNGKNRGFAFITMASTEEGQAVVDKFDSYELLGRIIRVEFAKSYNKPSPPPPERESAEVIQYKIYASNLAWKVRSNNLREFFSAQFKPLSARVVFNKRQAAGYGFVAFATKEEADAAISELNEKELMGRPVRLRMSQKKGEESESETKEASSTEEQPEES